MSDPRGDGSFWAGVQHEELPHCGLCDPDTRHIERDDGRIARCPRCWPPHGDKPNAPRPDDLLPQHWRCPACRALIYRDQRGLPCDRHRTVAAWHRERDEAAAGQDPLMADPVAETGAKGARDQLATRPRPAVPDRPPDPTTGLWGEALARAQVEQARRDRLADVGPADPDPDPETTDPETTDPDPDERKEEPAEYEPPF